MNIKKKEELKIICLLKMSLLRFFLTSNKNKKFELELYDCYNPKKLKFKR